MSYRLNDASSVAVPATPREVRLADYAPPAYLVDTVDLTFDLDEAATKVTARLALRRNPASTDRTAPLRLDGERMTLLRLVCNDETLSANQYHLDDHALIIPDSPDACTLTIETRTAPKDNTELTGLYVSNHSYFTQCEAKVSAASRSSPTGPT